MMMVYMATVVTHQVLSCGKYFRAKLAPEIIKNLQSVPILGVFSKSDHT